MLRPFGGYFSKRYAKRKADYPLRMNNVDNQLLIFYREKGSSGVCGVEMWKKSTVGIPQFPSLPLKSCCRPLLVALFIGGMLYHYNKIWCSCSGCIFFRVGVFLTFIREGLLERKSYQPAVCEIDIKPV